MSKYRNLSKDVDLFSAVAHQKKISDGKQGILKLKDSIDWEGFRSVLEEVTGYQDKQWEKGGRPPTDPVFMFKVLVLQKYYGLSDDATEYQMSVRLDFMDFLNITPGDIVPDANTIWDFKELIEQDDRNGSARLFEEFHAILMNQGLLAKEGSIIDASFVDAPRQRNTREQNKEIKEGKRPEEFDLSSPKGQQKDCDARWTKKNNETHYGYKNHAKIDAKSKLIDTYSTTPANVHDSQVFEELLDESDQAVLADSAYHSEEHENYLLEIHAEEFLMRKSHRNKPLSEEDQVWNKKVSRIRVRVEHVFGRMAHMGMDCIRSIGLKRAKQHNSLCNLVYNMDRFSYLTR